MFSASFDTGSLATLTRLMGFSALLDPNIQEALTEAGTILTDAAVANTWEVFENPTGELAGTIYPWLKSPSEMEIRVDSPYGRRQELGGGGLFDSLGRPMTNPAKPYLAPALAANEDEVKALIAEAVQITMSEMGG